MSDGARFPYPIAARIAQQYSELISPFCKQVQIVGSVRRHKADCGDIEIMCIPVPEFKYDLFGEGSPDPNLTNNLLQGNIKDLARRNGMTLEKNGPKYKRILLREGIHLDLFMSRPESWGVELAIRTGPAEFSRRCVMPRKIGGWLPSDCRVHNGWQVYRNAKVLPIRDEREFLEFIGLGWVEPWARHERLEAGQSIQPRVNP
jgi:DNA polymerase/3'-5' exonuclease PolX